MTFRTGVFLISTIALAACTTGGFGASKVSPYAPGRATWQQAEDGLEVGHRLMAAGEHELALKSFTRAALQHGLTAEVLTALGSANLGLGRLGQAEDLLRDAIEKEEHWAEPWNNLGVVLMEQGKTAEAAQIFRKAYALDNGESDSIRDNLRLALAKLENPVYDDENTQEYKLVRRGSADYLIRRTP